MDLLPTPNLPWAQTSPRWAGWGCQGCELSHSALPKVTLWASLLVPTASPGLGAGSGDTSGDSIPVCAQGPCGAPGEPGEKGQRGYAVSEGCGDTLERLSAPSGLSWDPQGPCPSWISPWLGEGES